MAKADDIIRLPVPDLSKVGKEENPVALEVVLHESAVSTGNIRGFPCLIFDTMLPGTGVPMAIRITVPLSGGIAALRSIGEGMLREAEQIEKMVDGSQNNHPA